jgi:DNA-3-methyladenine glycosylase II
MVETIRSERDGRLPAGMRRLLALDGDFRRVLRQAGPLPWRTRPRGFAGLLQAIVGQQISNQAAGAIWRRLAPIAAAHDPASFARLPDAVLGEAGLSRGKIAASRALAEAFALQHLSAEALEAMADEAAIAALVALPGIGRWTAEVYLLFAHERADVFPAGDLALAAAAADLKGLQHRPRERALREMAGAWRPHRSLAARLLWHHWRHVTGRPAMDDPPAA